MNKTELIQTLDDKNVPRQSYSLGELKNGECLCVIEEEGIWKVVYNSRGKITDSTSCASEEAAYDEVFKQIADAYGWGENKSHQGIIGGGDK